MCPSFANGVIPVAVPCPSAALLQMAVLEVAVKHTQLCFAPFFKSGNQLHGCESSCSEGKRHSGFAL